MTAELLREAAARMRQDSDTRWHAVADWLDDEAVGAQTPEGQPTAHSLAVARAYLGRDA